MHAKLETPVTDDLSGNGARRAILLFDVVLRRSDVVLGWEQVRQFFRRVETIVRGARPQAFRSTGDGILAIFSNSLEAFDCAKSILKFLRDEPVGPGNARLMARIGIHAGEVKIISTPYGEDAQGPAVSLAARLAWLGEPDELVLSDAAFADLRADQQAGFYPPEPEPVRGLSEPIQIHRLAASAS
jgi:class 3 adenylate cyclase